MMQVADIPSPDDRTEADFEALLGREDTASIVDSLLAIPDEVRLEAEAGPVGRAVHDRLQARLAAKMRRLIEADERRGSDVDRRDAA